MSRPHPPPVGRTGVVQRCGGTTEFSGVFPVLWTARKSPTGKFPSSFRHRMTRPSLVRYHLIAALRHKTDFLIGFSNLAFDHTSSGPCHVVRALVKSCSFGSLGSRVTSGVGVATHTERSFGIVTRSRHNVNFHSSVGAETVGV